MEELILRKKLHEYQSIFKNMENDLQSSRSQTMKILLDNLGNTYNQKKITSLIFDITKFNNIFREKSNKFLNSINRTLRSDNIGQHCQLKYTYYSDVFKVDNIKRGTNYIPFIFSPETMVFDYLKNDNFNGTVNNSNTLAKIKFCFVKDTDGYYLYSYRCNFNVYFVAENGVYYEFDIKENLYPAIYNSLSQHWIQKPQ